MYIHKSIDITYVDVKDRCSPCSPDMNLPDFEFFPKPKKRCRGKGFQTIEKTLMQRAW